MNLFMNNFTWQVSTPTRVIKTSAGTSNFYTFRWQAVLHDRSALFLRNEQVGLSGCGLQHVELCSNLATYGCSCSHPKSQTIPSHSLRLPPDFVEIIKVVWWIIRLHSMFLLVTKYSSIGVSMLSFGRCEKSPPRREWGLTNLMIGSSFEWDRHPSSHVWLKYRGPWSVESGITK